MKKDTSRKKAGDQIGDSDGFVLPVAPPPAPLGHVPGSKRTSEPIPEPSSSSNASGDGVPAASEPRFVLAPAADKPDSDTTDQTAPLISDSTGKSAPWSLVILLVCLVIGLLFVIVNRSNEAPEIAPPVSPSGMDERELTSARNEVESMRNKAAQIEQGNAELKKRIAKLEQQQENESKVAEAKVEKLQREKKALEDSYLNSIAEVDSLKRQLQNAAPQDSPRTATPQTPPQEAPVVSIDTNLYRVTGLIEGDTLNVRSGPAASNAIVIRLHNGVEFSVVGAAVANGPDLWLPCVIDNTFPDFSTGQNRSIKQRGWVNSTFAEQVPNQ